MLRTVCVIGGGPAGVEAARAAAGAGARVTLVSEGPIGGRAGWDSLVPSKVWIAAASLLEHAETAEARGLISRARQPLDPAAVLAYIRRVASDWSGQQAAQLAALGVSVLQGLAVFEAPRRLAVHGTDGQLVGRIEADAIIIASGSVPRFPPAMRPDGKRVIAPRFMSSLEQLPSDMIVVGGGVTGAEFVSLFARLGVRVQWLVGPRGVLPGFVAEAGQILTEHLSRQGVELLRGQLAQRIEQTGSGVTVVMADGTSHRAAMVFLAIGRTPDLARLNLAAIGLAPAGDGRLATDLFGRTAVPGVYAIGDATGGPMLANRAMAQAWIAGRHAAGAVTPPFQPEAIIHAVYSAPEIAQVGMLASPEAQVVRVPLSRSLKLHLLDHAEGVLMVAYHPQKRHVLGALAAGYHAAELLTPFAIAIQQPTTLDALAVTYSAHPTVSELAFEAARAALIAAERLVAH